MVRTLCALVLLAGCLHLESAAAQARGQRLLLIDQHTGTTMTFIPDPGTGSTPSAAASTWRSALGRYAVGAFIAGTAVWIAYRWVATHLEYRKSPAQVVQETELLMLAIVDTYAAYPTTHAYLRGTQEFDAPAFRREVLTATSGICSLMEVTAQVQAQIDRVHERRMRTARELIKLAQRPQDMPTLQHRRQLEDTNETMVQLLQRLYELLKQLASFPEYPLQRVHEENAARESAYNHGQQTVMQPVHHYYDYQGATTDPAPHRPAPAPNLH